jgi:hypothetical protein
MEIKFHHITRSQMIVFQLVAIHYYYKFMFLFDLRILEYGQKVLFTKKLGILQMLLYSKSIL